MPRGRGRGGGGGGSGGGGGGGGQGEGEGGDEGGEDALGGDVREDVRDGDGGGVRGVRGVRGGGVVGMHHGVHQVGGTDVNLRTLFQDFNASRFVVFSSLLSFSILFALKMDDVLGWPWWAVFLPLWTWKAIAVSGAVVGSVVWWRRPQSRMNAEEYIQYKAMLVSLATHLLLLMFELLVADNLQSRRHLWILVFVPLVFVSLISVAICIWSVRHDRAFELELFCAVNVLQFIFLALKLDKSVSPPRLKFGRTRQ